jgi:hypothetical protein
MWSFSGQLKVTADSGERQELAARQPHDSEVTFRQAFYSDGDN